MNRLSSIKQPVQSLISSQRSRLLSTSVLRMSDKPSNLDADKGKVGAAFDSDGAIGKQGEKLGGPFSSKGAVGKEFKPDGAVGGTAQAAADQAQGNKPPVFDKDGAIGSAFTAQGAIGSIGEKVGGPFASDGAIGKNFNPDGAVGGTVQNNLGKESK